MIVFLLSHQIILCRNATGNLSFLCRKETIFIYFTVITFVVYEKNKTGPHKLRPIDFYPKFGRSPFQQKITDSERKTLTNWYKFSRRFLALCRFCPFTFSLMAWHERKKIILINYRLFTIEFFYFFRKKLTSFGQSYTSPLAIIKMNKERF